MEEKLKTTIQKIKALADQNPEFAQEMRKMFGNTSSVSVVSEGDSVSSNVIAIRKALEIRANESVSYNFVKEQRLRDQLIIDNLRMENAALDLQKKEDERFYTFCVNAFYQIENIINYYFHKTFPNIEDLLFVIEEYTKNEPSEYHQYKRPKRLVKNVGDIQIVFKILALYNILLPNDISKTTVGQLRQVRNEGAHRCMAIQQMKDENDYLYKFFKYNTFNTVRILLIRIVTTVEENIGKPIPLTKSTSK